MRCTRGCFNAVSSDDVGDVWNGKQNENRRVKASRNSNNNRRSLHEMNGWMYEDRPAARSGRFTAAVSGALRRA